jgi:hypothetical protein
MEARLDQRGNMVNYQESVLAAANESTEWCEMLLSVERTCRFGCEIPPATDGKRASINSGQKRVGANKQWLCE